MAETGAQLEATVGQVMTGLPIMSAAVLTASQRMAAAHGEDHVGIPDAGAGLDRLDVGDRGVSDRRRGRP